MRVEQDVEGRILRGSDPPRQGAVGDGRNRKGHQGRGGEPPGGGPAIHRDIGGRGRMLTDCLYQEKHGRLTLAKFTEASVADVQLPIPTLRLTYTDETLAAR